MKIIKDLKQFYESYLPECDTILLNIYVYFPIADVASQEGFTKPDSADQQPGDLIPSYEQVEC